MIELDGGPFPGLPWFPEHREKSVEENRPDVPVDKQVEFQKSQIKVLIAKVRAILSTKSDKQLSDLLRSSYEEVMQAFEADVLPVNVAHNVIQDFLVKLST